MWKVVQDVDVLVLSNLLNLFLSWYQLQKRHVFTNGNNTEKKLHNQEISNFLHILHEEEQKLEYHL